MKDKETTKPLSSNESDTALTADNGSAIEKDSDDDKAWVPGTIQVVFGSAERSGLREWWDSSEKMRRSDYSEDWSPELKQLLQSNELDEWGPSFPLSYPWSRDSREELLAFYQKSGRDRFVTFHFRPGGDLISLADKLEQLPEILRASLAPRLKPPCEPHQEPLVGNNDLLPGGQPETQWYLFRCGVDKAWAKASGDGVVIADIDWGFNPYHQDLFPQITTKKNTMDNSAGVSNGNKLDHGTAVLGLAGGAVNCLGMAGIAYKASLWAIQAGMDDIENELHWLSGIDFVRSEATTARKVMILELQTKTGWNIELSDTINKAIKDAIYAGVVACVPAGNAGVDAGLDPNHKPIPPTGSVLVGATKYDPQLNIRGTSNVGCRIVVYAPGDEKHDLTCDVPATDGYTRFFGGTSGAVAKVAGVVALMLSVNDKLTQAEICEILADSPKIVVDGSGNEVGVLVDAERAVSQALKRKGGGRADVRADSYAPNIPRIP
jgi:subtilisin family serine protease